MVEDDHLTAQKYLDITASARFIGMKWKEEALCLQMVANDQADPLDWFPETSGLPVGTVPERAKAVCKLCPVRLECLCLGIYASEKNGIWGGRSARHIQKVRRKLMRLLR